MDILVADISILNDCERAGLEEIALVVGHRWLVPDLLYETALKDGNGQAWLRRGLTTIELEPHEVATAQAHFIRQAKLSLSDCFAFALAQHRHWALLSGDGTLRSLATEHTLACYGFCWAIELATRAGADVVRVEQGLRRLLAHPQCRQPRTGIEALLGSLHESRRLP
jgi:hypothetical protein